MKKHALHKYIGIRQRERDIAREVENKKSLRSKMINFQKIFQKISTAKKLQIMQQFCTITAEIPIKITAYISQFNQIKIKLFYL